MPRFKYSILELMAAILLVVSMQPVYVWGYDLFLINYILVFIFLIHVRFKDAKNNLLFLFFVLVLSIHPIYHGQNIFGFLALVSFSVLPFSDTNYLRNVYIIFRRLICIITAISAVVWFLVFVFQVSLPSQVIPPLNDLKDYNYVKFPFLVITGNISNLGELFRFCSVFDEPGVVGTYCFLFLAADRFNLKNLESWIFMLGGIISFSLFFFVGSAVYYICELFTQRGNIKKKIIGFSVLLVFVISIQFIPVLNTAIGQRLEYDATTGKLAGDNRSSSALDDYIQSIFGTSEFFFGSDANTVESFAYSASINNAILKFGALMVFLYFVFFFLYSMKHFRRSFREVLLFMLVITITLFQRPGLQEPSFIIMFLGYIIFHKESFISKYVVNE